MKRAEGRLVFYRGSDDGSLQEIGWYPFSDDPVDQVELHVWPRETTDALEVQFDRLHIVADRIRARSDVPTSVRLGAVWWGIGALTVAAAGFVAWRRREGTTRWSTEQPRSATHGGQFGEIAPGLHADRGAGCRVGDRDPDRAAPTGGSFRA